MIEGPKQERDPRKALWEISKSRASEKASAVALMAVLESLWFERGVHDLVVANRVAVTIAELPHPYAYLDPDGVALRSLLEALGIGRKP